MTLIGALAYPLLERASSGKPVCELLIGGELSNPDGSLMASFIPVKAFGTLAQDAQQYLTAGTPVLIKGELEMNSYGGRDSTEIIASVIEVLPDLLELVVWEDVDNTHGRRARLPLDHCINQIEQLVNLTADPERKAEGLVIARCGWNSWVRAGVPGEDDTKKSHYGELRGIDEVGDALLTFRKGQRLLVHSRAYLRIHAVRGSTRQNRTIQSEVYYVEPTSRLKAHGAATALQANAEHQTPQEPGRPVLDQGAPAEAHVPPEVPQVLAPAEERSEHAADPVGPAVNVPPGTELPPVMPRPAAHLPSFPLPRAPQQDQGPVVGQVMTLPPDTEAQPLPAMLRSAFGTEPQQAEADDLGDVHSGTDDLGADEFDRDNHDPDDGHPDLHELDL